MFWPEESDKLIKLGPIRQEQPSVFTLFSGINMVEGNDKLQIIVKRDQ